MFNRLFGPVFAVMVAIASLPAHAAETKFLPGHLIPATEGRPSTGRLAPSRQLDLALGLPVRDPDGLTRLLAELYDPAGPNFHRWVAPEEFTARFGPTDADYAAVEEFARTNGFTVVGRHPNRLLLDVRAAAGDVEHAFHLTLRTYAHQREPGDFFAPDTEPSVEASLPIADVSGLSDYGRPRPLARPRPLGVKPNGTGSAGGAFIGNDFRAAYVPGSALTGAGQTVGLVQFDGFYAADITAYETQAGLPAVPLQTVLIDGFNGVPTTGANSGNGEVSLDIEMVISMAPGLAKLIVYEGSPNNFIPNDVLNRIATDNQAKQISSSWSWTGGPSTTTDAILQQYAAQGQSYFTASGDSDAYTGANVLDAASNYTAPVASPYVTSVGGTTLSTTGPGGAYVSETVWNWGNNVGSSGGISTHYAIPSWQTGATLGSNQRSTTMRNIPDVALTGDNVYVKYGNGSSGVFGGTSCAAPLWAGFMALINQQAAMSGNPPLGFLNPALYSLAESASYAATFHDVTAGNNIGTNTPGLYFATAGYDLCTGWGSPSGSALIDALAPLVPTPLIAANGTSLLAESGSPANAAVDPGETVTLNFTLKNNGGAATTNLVATLLPNSGILAPSGPRSYGVVAATGGTAAQAFTFTTAGTCGATLTATLQLQDGDSNLGTITFPILLGTATPAQRPVQNFDAVTVPALPAGWTSQNLTGTSASWVTTTASKDTAPNSAHLADTTTIAENALVSPALSIYTASAQLVFRQSYRLESSRSTYYDGGVLEIKIGSGAFTDILAAGGRFASNGYNGTITTSSDNPIRGRQAWVGNGSTWKTVAVNLPAAAAGQTVQFRWALATDSGNSGTVTGWYVDSITLNDAASLCTPIAADLAVGLSLTPDSLLAGENLVYTLAVTNAGPQPASEVVLSDTFPNNLVFQSASPGATLNGNLVSWNLGTLPAQAGTNLTLTFAPGDFGPFANSAAISTVTPDAVATNNTASLTSTQSGPQPAAVAGQPADVAVTLGGTAVFQATASGTEPLTYQWFFNATNLLPGATAATLTLANVQPEQAGPYFVVVSNVYGIATSAVAMLTVLLPPAITAQPQDQTVLGGSNVAFTVAATGTPPLNFQWFFNGTNLLAGATAPTLTLTGVGAAQAGQYSAVVTNAYGSATSAGALLTVLLPPTITAQPQGQSVLVGSNASFTVAVTGTAPLAYQWYLNETNLLAGATGPTLTLTSVQPEQAGDYSVLVTNAYGSVSSKGAQLTVRVPPVITQQPQDQVVWPGTNAAFSVVATGASPLVYQWFFNGTNLLASETGSELSLTNVQLEQAGQYSVTVTNAYGAVASSNAALVVIVPPVVTAQPQDFTALAGTTARFTVAADGAAPLAYQWFFNGTNLLAGETGSDLTLANVQPGQSGQYSITITNAFGTVTSSNATLVVVVPPAITAQPQDLSVLAGTTAQFSVVADGTGPLAYQWFFNATNLLAGETNSWLALANAQPDLSGGYSVTVTNRGGSAVSAAAVLRVLVPPTLSPTDLQLGPAPASIALPSVAGLTYTLEFTDSFTPADWQPVAPAVPGTGGTIVLPDTNTPPATGTRYYRVRCE